MENKVVMDAPNDKPEIPISINEVGISNQKIYVKIKDPFDTKKYRHVLCDLEVSIGLPADKRGIHVSRIERQILSSAADGYSTLSNFSQNLSQKVFRTQSCNKVKIKLYGILPYDLKTPETNLNSSQSIKIISEVMFDGKALRNVVGLEVYTIVACPCVQRYYSVMFDSDTNLQNKKISEDTTKEIAKLITHTQRGKLLLKVEDINNRITVKDLMKVIEKSVFLGHHLLKRPDERNLIKSVLEKPQFVEDIVRKVAFEVCQSFRSIIEGIEIRATSYESIHPHNMEAYLKADIKDWRNTRALCE